MQEVGVVGCGLMGAGIAEVCARAGLDVTVAESSEDAAAAGWARLVKSMERAEAKGRIESAAAVDVEVAHTRDHDQLLRLRRVRVEAVGLVGTHQEIELGSHQQQRPRRHLLDVELGLEGHQQLDRLQGEVGVGELGILGHHTGVVLLGLRVGNHDPVLLDRPRLARRHPLATLLGDLRRGGAGRPSCAACSASSAHSRRSAPRPRCSARARRQHPPGRPARHRSSSRRGAADWGRRSAGSTGR